MSAFQKPSQAAPEIYADSGVRGISKYNFNNYNTYKEKLTNIYKDSEKIVEKYNTQKEIYDTKVIKYEKTITMQDVLEDNKIILLNSKLPVGLAATGAGADDRKPNMSQLQKDIIRNIREPKEYNPYKAQQQMNSHFMVLHKNIEIYKEKYIKMQMEKEKGTYLNMLYTIVTSPVVVYLTPVLVGVGFNLLVVASITNPATWIAMLPTITAYLGTTATATATTAATTAAGVGATGVGVATEIATTALSIGPATWISFGQKVFSYIGGVNIYFHGFLDLFYTAGFFDITDVGNLTKLYNDMVIYSKTPGVNMDPDAIKTIITNIFEGKIDASLEENKFYVFFKYIYDCIKRKDIFNQNPTNIDMTNMSWLAIVTSFANTPNGQFILSSLKLASNMFSYINTTSALLSKYEDINKMIVFEAAFKYGTNSRTFHEITRYFSTSTVEGASKFLQWLNIPGNNISNNAFTSFVGNIWSNEYNPLQKMWESEYNPVPAISKYVPDFFTMTIDGLYKFAITSGPNAYFAGLKKEADANKKTKQKTEKEQILSIEQEVIKISKYKKEAYSNEEIVELLDPKPDEPNNYRLTASRYIVDFKKKFKKFIKNPQMFAKNITLYCNGWVLVNFLIQNMHNMSFGVAVSVVNGYVLKGYDVVNLRDLFPFSWAKSLLSKGTIIELLSFYIKMYYGTSEALQQRLENYKRTLIADIVNDIQQFHTDVQNLFYDSEIGISLTKYFKNINDLWIMKAVNISVKIMYFIAAVPLLNVGVSQIVNPTMDAFKIDIFSILDNPDKLKKFNTFLNNKVSNIFRALTKWDGAKVITELKEFSDINKILLKTVIPYLTADGYYELYGRQNEQNLKGNMVEFKDETGQTESEAVILDVEKVEPAEEGQQPDTDFTLFNPSDLLTYFISNNAPGSDNIITITDPNNPDRNIYDIFYAYYLQDFEKKQKADPKKYASFDVYLKELYYSSYRIVHDLPENFIPKLTAEEETKGEIEEIEETKGEIEETKETKEPEVVPAEVVPVLPKKKLTNAQIIELGILGKVLKIYEDKKMEKSGYVDLSPGLLEFKWVPKKLTYDYWFGSGSPALPPAIEVPYDIYPDLKMANSGEIQLIEGFLAGNADGFIAEKLTKINQRKMIPSNTYITLALPNSYGFRFDENVSVQDLFTISTIMEYFLTVPESQAPNVLLSDAEGYGTEDSYILNKLGDMNIVYNTEFIKVIKHILKFSNDIKDDFSNFDKVLPLNFLNFDYSSFAVKCYEFLTNTSMKLQLPSGNEDIIFKLFQNVLKFSKMCYSSDKKLTLMDTYGYNINTNETDVSCDKTTALDFSTQTPEIKKEIITQLLMRPDIIQYLHAHHYELTDNFTNAQKEMEEREKEQEAIRKQKTYEPLQPSLPVSSAEVDNTDAIIYGFIKSNEEIIDTMHDEMISLIIATIDEDVAPDQFNLEKEIEELKADVEKLNETGKKLDEQMIEAYENVKYVKGLTSYEDATNITPETLGPIINQLQTVTNELTRKTNDLTKKSEELEKKTLLRSFGELLKKIQRNMLMDDSFKDAVYKYFDFPKQDILNVGLLEREKQSELTRIDAACNSKNKDEILELYKNFNFNPNANVGLVSFNVDEAIKNANSKFYKKDQTLDILQNSFNNILYQKIILTQRLSYFEGSPATINCVDYDITNMKQYINLKYEIYERIKRKRAYNFYQLGNRNVNRYEGDIKTRIDEFGKDLNDIITEAKIRDENRKAQTMPGVNYLLGNQPTDKGQPTTSDKLIPEQKPEIGQKPEQKPLGQKPLGQTTGQQQKSEQTTESGQRGQKLGEAAKRAEKEQLEQQQKTDEKEQQQQEQKTKEESSLQYMMGLLFGGDDGGWISNMASMLRNLTGAKLKTTGKNFGSLSELEKDDTDKSPFKDNFAWCKEHAEMWYMQNNEVMINGIGKAKGIDKTDIIGKCQKKSLFGIAVTSGSALFLEILEKIGQVFLVVYNGTLLVTNATLWSLRGAALITAVPAPPLSAFLTKTSYAVAKFYKLINMPYIKTLLQSVAACLPMWFLYFSSVAIEGIQDNKYLGANVIKLSYIFISKKVKEKYDKGFAAATKLACGEALRIYARKNSIDEIVDTSTRAILGSFGRDAQGNRPDYYRDPTQNNFFMFINTGLKDPNSDNYENDPMFIAEVFAELLLGLSEPQQEKIKKLGEIDFNGDCSVYNKYDIVEAAISAIMNPLKADVIYNMFFCKILDSPPPTYNQLWSITWWLKLPLKLLYALFYDKLSNEILVPLFKFILPKKKVRNYLLTQIFGNSSVDPENKNNQDTQVNINVARDEINKSIDSLLEKSTDKKTGEIDDAKLKEVIKMEITGVFSQVFNAFWSNFYHYLQSNGGKQIPPFKFDAEDEFKNQCITSNCSINESVDNPDKHAKEFIRKAICEMLYKNGAPNIVIPKENASIFGSDPTIFCDSVKFYAQYGIQNGNAFGNLVNSLITNIRSVKSFDKFKISEIALNANIDPADKKTTQEDYIKRYFKGLTQMLLHYKQAKVPEIEQTMMNQFLQEKINSEENVDIKYRLENIKGLMINNSNKKTAIGIATLMTQMLIDVCDKDKHLAQVPVSTDSSGKVIYKYECIVDTSSEYDEVQEEYEKKFKYSLAKEKTSNQIEIIDDIISNLMGKISGEKESADSQLQFQKIKKLLNPDQTVGEDDIKFVPDKVFKILQEIYNDLRINIAEDADYKKLDEELLIRQIKINSKNAKNSKNTETLEKTVPFISIQTYITLTTSPLQNAEYEDKLNELDKLYVDIFDKKNKSEASGAVGPDISSEIENIKSIIGKLLDDMEKDEKIKDKSKISEFKKLTQTITADNILPPNIQVDPQWIPYIPDDSELFSDAKASENYIVNVLKNPDVFKDKSGSVDYGYLIYIYLKFIYNNSDDYADGTIDIMTVLYTIKNGGFFNSLTDADVEKILPISKSDPSYELLKTSLTGLFKSDEKFREALYSTLLSQQKGPIVKPYYLTPNNIPQIDKGDKDRKGVPLLVTPTVADDLIVKKDYVSETTEFAEYAQKEFLYDGLRNLYGRAIIPTTDGRLSLKPVSDENKLYYAAGMVPYEYSGLLGNIKQDKNLSSENKDALSRITINSDVYKNGLLGEPSKYTRPQSLVEKQAIMLENNDATLISNYKASTNKGSPPILIDINCNLNNPNEQLIQQFRNDYKTRTGIVNSKYLTANRDNSKLAGKLNKLLSENYEKIEVADENGVKKCIWLLKIDIAYFAGMFEGFDKEKYAKSLLDSNDETTKISNIITPQLIKANEKSSVSIFLPVLTNTSPEFVKQYISLVGVEFNYFEEFGIKGLKDATGNTLSLSDLKEIYGSEGIKYVDANGSEQTVKLAEADLNEFITNLIPMSMLYGRKGVVGGGLQQRINVEGSVPIITDQNYDVRKFTTINPQKP